MSLPTQISLDDMPISDPIDEEEEENVLDEEAVQCLPNALENWTLLLMLKI